MSVTENRWIATLAAGAVLLVGAACGSSSKADVATVKGATQTKGKLAKTADAKANEKSVLDYLECLRGQGLDVSDPVGFDPDGHAQWDFSRMDFRNFDREKFRAAAEKCGQPPEAARPRFTPEDRAAFQDAGLKFAECMRGKGINIPDPDFSQNQAGGQGGGMFRDINRDDPAVKAAIDECRSAFDSVRARLGRNTAR